MKIYSHLNKLAHLRLNRPIVTWGIFDGVHLGHQKLIQEVVRWARKIKGTSVVITFQEHPRKILKNQPPLYITSLSHRLLLLERLGVAVTIIHPFTDKFARVSPEEFIRDIIKLKIRAYGIIVSNKTRFGCNRKGDINLLKRLCVGYGIRLRIITEKCYQRQIISSSLIRQAIRKGDLVKAKSMLGRNVTLFGTVIRGHGRGRKLGIPTANLDLYHELVPPRGVYAARARIFHKTYNALANIGYRPTFSPPSKNLVVEVHLLGFKQPNQNLYGQDMEVELLKRLRPEKKFPNSRLLLEQIERDKKYFA